LGHPVVAERDCVTSSIHAADGDMVNALDLDHVIDKFAQTLQ